MKRTESKREKTPFYLVSTPIGNLADITYRAVQVLKEVDYILCEDTRVTKRLLNFYGIEKPLQSYHAKSNEKKEESILEQACRGTRYALVSDAGTPSISDPGVHILQKIYQNCFEEIEIIPIPGPTAVIAALSISAFPGNQFTFYGFLPQKKGRKKIVGEMLRSERISVFYESPYRILKLFSLVRDEFPEFYETREVFLARELTKLFEEKIRGSFKEVHELLMTYPEKLKGEFVIIISP